MTTETPALFLLSSISTVLYNEEGPQKASAPGAHCSLIPRVKRYGQEVIWEARIVRPVDAATLPGVVSGLSPYVVGPHAA